MNIKSTLPLFALSVLFFASCSKDQLATDQQPGNEATFRKSGNQANINSAKCVDIDGNVYKTIRIGNQVWMAENLRVTRYRNGQAIQHVPDASIWAGLGSGTVKGAW